MQRLGLCPRGGDSIDLAIVTDQVDSVRMLATEEGNAVSSIEYDSFGNVIRSSLPDLFFPLGFACGLNDPFTGFVRFGFRDYDPETGRFTAKDPLGDTGGDHDPWEYCVDDPVSMQDPAGLAPGLSTETIGALIAGMGSTLAKAIARGGIRVAGWMADSASGAFGKKTTKGREGAQKAIDLLDGYDEKKIDAEGKAIKAIIRKGHK